MCKFSCKKFSFLFSYYSLKVSFFKTLMKNDMYMTISRRRFGIGSPRTRCISALVLVLTAVVPSLPFYFFGVNESFTVPDNVAFIIPI